MNFPEREPAQEQSENPALIRSFPKKKDQRRALIAFFSSQQAAAAFSAKSVPEDA